MSEWKPPVPADREDGYQCLIWHRDRWRHVSWAAKLRGWMFGYASAYCVDTPGRLYAPLPEYTPKDFGFFDGEQS